MMKTYTRLLSFASPMGRYAVPYFFYSVFHAIFNTFTYTMIIPIVGTLFSEGYEFKPTYELPQFELNTEFLNGAISYAYTAIFGSEYMITKLLALLSAILIMSNMLSNLFRYLGAMTVETLRTRTLQNMRNRMFESTMAMNVGYFSEQRKGDIMSKITSDVMVVQFCITNTLQVAFREPFLIIGYCVMMVKISWELTVFSILYLPIVGLIIGSIVKRLRHPAQRGQERMGDLVSVMEESLTGVKAVKSYNAFGYIREKFRAINGEMSNILLSMARKQQLASPMSEFLGITAISVVLVFGGALVMNGSMSASGFVAYIAAFSQLTRPLRSFIDQFANINQGIAAGERIFSIIDAKSSVEDKPNALKLGEFRDKIEFKNISFSYDGQREILHNISFEVRKGETVALVGPSGGGKSTLSELIPRFYDPVCGEILVDGRPLSDYNQESVREHMGIVSQDTILFNDTIRNNIAMGRLSASNEQIEAAARVANAHDFIMQTEQGYDTNIGDRGMKLSGGQRQRLSIARAVLKNPEILILDEATSALDTESEKLVQEALTTLLEGRTSVVIAHRLSTIHNADRIIVIDSGRIAEQGTHSELMARGGIYAKLIEMQSLQ
ncbi:MAG: ABC transporter ATP-binding protein [Alistipes sp.]|nr:ABC transporter ATP-binding protein [Alistipes sp.]MBO5465488.1 ABC transporter ATP-binding protein [Alistipes sp.]MBR2398781.1 ABC transporter ATP-binding protein [Alistipes sp.]